MSSDNVYDELLQKITAAISLLPDKPEETAENTLRALWLFAHGTPSSAIAAARLDLPPLTPASEALLRSSVAQRLGGVPLSHIVGRQHFMGMEMLAGPEALVPRVETELLAGVAISLARDLQPATGQLRIIDVCTGSGNVALAIANGVARAQVFAADLSEEAVALARRNAVHTGLADRVEFAVGDLLKPFDSTGWLGSTDVLTCNPPYISSAKVGDMASEISAHEPMLAFDGGPFGVSILFRLLQDAPRFLRAGGWLAFEVGLGQGPAMAKRLAGNSAFEQIQQHADGAGNVRVLAARRRQ